jgi:hypothetical protein
MDLDNRQAAQTSNFVQFAYNMFSIGGLMRTFAAICPYGMLAEIPRPALVTGGMHEC